MSFLTSSPTQFEAFSDTARFYSSQFKWKSLVLHYRFTFCIIPFHLNSCCTVPPLSSSGHEGLWVSLHNDVVIERPHSKIIFENCLVLLSGNFDLACDLLNESDWNSMFSNASNVNQHWSSWQKRFLEIMEICIPKEGLPSKRISLGSLHHCLAQ